MPHKNIYGWTIFRVNINASLASNKTKTQKEQKTVLLKAPNPEWSRTWVLTLKSAPISRGHFCSLPRKETREFRYSYAIQKGDATRVVLSVGWRSYNVRTSPRQECAQAKKDCEYPTPSSGQRSYLFINTLYAQRLEAQRGARHQRHTVTLIA